MASTALDMLRRMLPARRHRRKPAAPRVPQGDVIFRLRSWPSLPEDGRTAEVYRMLSVMSNQPVRRQWLLARFTLGPQQLDALLQQLVAQGSVEVIDPARFARG